MSEYQYYEFLALDQPLSEADIEALRTVSSRAEISATRFVNVYHYGDFRGDVMKLMTEYFDLMVYVANWGTHRLLLRLPRECFDIEALQAYCPGDSATVKEQGDWLIWDLCSSLEDAYDWEEGAGWIDTLHPVRDELLRGDFRTAYLGWLLCAGYDWLKDDTVEPPVPPGLGELSEPLLKLAGFLRIDPDLLAAAAEHSGPLEVQSPEQLEQWIAALPEAEKNRLLLAVIQGHDPLLGPRLRARFAKESKPPAPSAPPTRTLKDLRERAEARRLLREAEERRRAAEEQARRDAEAKAARAKRLDRIASHQSEVWRQVETLIEAKQAKPYAEAAALLGDLHTIAEREHQQSAFQTKLAGLYERHAKKRSFWDRIEKLKIAPNLH